MADLRDPRSIDDYLRGARSVNIRATKAAKLADWFQGRQWRIMTELTGDSWGGAVKEGEFRVNPPESLKSPLGNVLRHGYLIQEVGPDGNDLSTRPAAFGIQVLRRATEMYGSVVNLPPRRSRGRPRKT